MRINIGKVDLKDIKTGETSLVDKAANKRVFYLIKNQGEVIMDEKIKSLFKKIGLKDFEPKIEKMRKEDVKSLEEAFEPFLKYDESLPDELKNALKKLAENYILTQKADEPADNKSNADKGDDSGNPTEKKEDAVIKGILEMITSIVAVLEKTKEPTEEEKLAEEKAKVPESIKTLQERISNLEKRTGGKSTVDDVEKGDEKMTGKWQGLRKGMNLD